MPDLFYDAVTPANIPAKARACLYNDGRYKASAEEAKRFSAVRWITVLGGGAAAAGAGCCDYEQGNPAFDGPSLREWALARQAMDCRARVYTDLSNAPSAHAKVGDLPNVVWWVSTLDGKQLTAAQIVKAVATFGVTLAEKAIWALQYEGGMTAKYDTSILLGTW